MSQTRRCDLHLTALEGLHGRSAIILFPDGWYGRPHDTVFLVEDVVIESDPVKIAIRDFGLLLIERDCAVLAIASQLVSVRLGSGMRRCFDGKTTSYEAGFLNFVLDERPASPFVDLHFFMSPSGAPSR